MSFFARVFRSRDSSSSKKLAKQLSIKAAAPPKPQWTDAWLRKEVTPEEVQELLRGCTQELKARALDTPFFLLPFRPSSDPSAARTFIRNYFHPSPERAGTLRGEDLMQELRLTEPMVLCSVVKWCWSRLPGGVVTWEAYELFRVGEQDSQVARDAFSTFIPLSVESDARTKIIFDFFDLMAAVAAHGKSNGMGGRKLSRFAGWWAFEHTDTGNGFEASYKNWTSAADAASHLFFAYLRSQSPDSLRGTNGISTLPISLQTLLQATEYPPEAPSLLQIETTKVVMIVDTVSPTPFSLLRRAKNFEYRDSDHVLQNFSSYDDPVRALTDECRRVLRCISSVNQSNVSTSKASTSLRDASWSRFQDIGFSATIEESDMEDEFDGSALPKNKGPLSLRSAPHSRCPDLGRPTTPSWADFLSSGFADENEAKSHPPLLLPPDKVLPPIHTVRGQSSQSHKRPFDSESVLEPGELASISRFDLDDSFWWVWISSLSGEEPAARKAVFGRCALIETIISGGRWLVLEEQVKGAAPEPEVGAYIAEKKGFFGFRSRKGRLTRRKSAVKTTPIQEPYQRSNSVTPMSKTSIGPDQHARIQAAAAALQRKHREQEEQRANERRARVEETAAAKTASVLTMQPLILSEASQAMKWASNYDKHAVRAAYLGNSLAGTGVPADALNLPTNGIPPHRSSSLVRENEAPVVPKKESPPAPVPVAQQEIKPVKSVSPEPASVSSPKAAAAEPLEAAPTEPKSPERNQAVAKKSSESTEDHTKKLKKKPATTGLKGMFGKKKTEVPVKSTTAESSLVVAPAKAASEGRAALATQPSSLPIPKAPATHRLSGFGRKKYQETTPAPETPKPMALAVVEVPPQATKQPVQPIPATTEYDGPPRTRRDAEYDALSRVDSSERVQADREFASFDHQSPFVDQPAFVPEDTPTTDHFPEPLKANPYIEPQTTKQTEQAMNGHQKKSAPSPVEIEVPVQDRWAQIRKNAAERAVLSSNNNNNNNNPNNNHVGTNNDVQTPARMSQAEKTDDGETSGEETIESRVARIKARVAELTGNIEAAR